MKQLSSLSRSGGFLRWLWGICAFVLVGCIVTTLLQAEVSEADKKKRDAFLKAREEMRTVPSAKSRQSPTPSGKPKAARKKKKTRSATEAEEEKTPAAKRRPTPDEEEEEATTPRPSKRKNASPSPTETPEPAQKSEPDLPRRAASPRATAEERPAPTRVPAPAATPIRPVPNGAAPPSDITIRKSGLEEEQGFEPPPPPPRRGFLSRVFGGREPTYRYLSRSVINAIRRAPVQRSRWKFIIVHNSGTRQGNARAFDYYHRHVRRMKNGLAYHFVVGNGSSSGNGEIEIGDRWRRQINGGHVHSDYLNNISLGICLVGDFNRDHPTRVQLEATEELIRYLRERCGKADGRTIPVRPHREMNPPRWATDCPGDDFPYGWFRRF
ncbi:MAG TPA: N-acetylmuramoyl-L-alanine amidase [Chthoniobacterales bacterium]|nr:N-acetylmuramoyl-L-alanine amidase [Chthoniobacterales bacterium]